MASVTVQAGNVLTYLIMMSFFTVDLIQTLCYEDRSVALMMEISCDVTWKGWFLLALRRFLNFALLYAFFSAPILDCSSPPATERIPIALAEEIRNYLKKMHYWLNCRRWNMYCTRLHFRLAEGSKPHSFLRSLILLLLHKVTGVSESWNLPSFKRASALSRPMRR